jgi:hypothetical protein
MGKSLRREATMKRPMVGILAVVLVAAFAAPVLAITPYAADVKQGSTEDCGNVVVSTGGTLIATINLSGDCAPEYVGPTTTIDVCAVLGTARTLITSVSDNNPNDGRISLLEGTKIGVFGPGEAFDFLEFQQGVPSNCGGEVQYTSGQPRPLPPP